MNPLAQYIKEKGGSLYRPCPVIAKIAEATGYSPETVYLAALGRRSSKRLDMALAKYQPKKKGRK